MSEKKIALITGGSRGIGFSCAKELAKAGCDIIINDICEQEKAQPALDELKSLGAQAWFYRFDVSNPEQVNEAVTQMIADHGHIDVLLNNAGITKDGLFIRMTPEQWEQVIKINLGSAYYVTHAVIKYMMKARQGSVINMSSIVGVHGNAGQANYSASKAGLIGLTKTLAKEFGSRNIRVNAVCPGFIQTAMTANLGNIDEYMKAIPMRRFGTPEDIAKVVKFLALDTDYVTGQAIEVAGGLML
ncbi:MAG: 3-oxoacyl-[acyl-carrier-protein] reductase [Cyanobacteriota bacterium]|nr:3-oxoacyl-[acyl-carrier-protein] reductase [Cyanobacteriota bacterium]MDY6358552.1 3-oxoacyl-[acyl-carrier-protein] reductase [Cyanobacteriota bacterium]MDY6363519.1 3-oxoacyl-[acyl-carrier-protein] reductase [Cyanobacteriota bacterium]MDY6383856.1 3-oxoacyl-[acyl-carrier-protein] reductase [Cyanobacteriota bacterium]